MPAAKWAQSPGPPRTPVQSVGGEAPGRDNSSCPHRATNPSRCYAASPMPPLAARTTELVEELQRLLPGRVSTTPPDRVAYARDLWPRGLITLAGGNPAPHPPDAVAWPTSTDEVVAIVRAAARTGTPIVPFGAGSGVCGGTLPIRGGVVVDLKRMRAIVELDERAGAATVEAGILGEHLEHELNRRGVTLGHFPSSIMCSTFGGWLAARSAGQLSTKYGKIEDLVRRLTFVDGRGEVHTVDAGQAPDVAQWLVGSEGTLGIITRATVTVRPLPEVRLYRGWAFPRVAAGCEAIRRLLQRNLKPACVRLYDELDSFLHRGEKEHGPGVPESSSLERWLSMLTSDGKSVAAEWKRRAVGLALTRPDLVNRVASTVLPYAQNGCLLIVGFEGERGLADAEAVAAGAELDRAGGRDLGEGPGERWLRHRYAVSFRMQKVFDAGAFVDTMEVATTWDKLLELYRAVREAVSPLAFLMAHFSHAYPDGCSIYFTFAARGVNSADAERKYDEIWRAGLAAVTQVGGTISHHHGVGLSKAPFMPEEHGAAMEIYRALKDVLDPARILNPGKMGL
jgi:alkyldihydroxyacetonephosphate synthase